MNKFMGLCTNTHGWPRMLYKIGFRVQLVEQRISTGSGSITPDVVAASDLLSHALVVDCKGGKSIDKPQDERYGRIRREDLANWIDVREQGRLTHAACYAASDSSHAKLRAHTSLPFIVFGRSFVKGIGSFGLPKLDKVLGKRTGLERSREPLALYPFSPDDHPSVALPFIIKGVVCCAAKSGAEVSRDFATEEGMTEVIKTIHPFYKSAGRRHAKLLVRKSAAWFNEMLEEDSGLEALYKKLLQEGFETRAVEAFADRCRAGIASRQSQRRMTDAF